MWPHATPGADRHADEVLDGRANVTVAEVTTRARGLAVEAPIGTDTGLDQASVVNGDRLRTVSQRMLSRRLGVAADDTLEEACSATAIALGCDER